MTDCYATTTYGLASLADMDSSPCAIGGSRALEGAGVALRPVPDLEDRRLIFLWPRHFSTCSLLDLTSNEGASEKRQRQWYPISFPLPENSEVAHPLNLVIIDTFIQLASHPLLFSTHLSYLVMRPGDSAGWLGPQVGSEEVL